MGKQGGVALVISMVLLTLVTLVGLSAMRQTTEQQKLAGNFYDREIAFQDAEAALNAAIEIYNSDPTATNLVWHDCQDGTTKCMGNPFDDATLPTANIHVISSGNTLTSYTTNSLAAEQPQFVIEDMGSYGSSSGTGQQTTSAENAGNEQIQTGLASTFIRITLRSADPASSDADNRAIVTLQAVVKQ